jgi:hypothetical protein
MTAVLARLGASTSTTTWASLARIHEQLTRLRGAQAGFWRKGWLLKIRVDALIAAHRTEPVDVDRQHEMRLLNGFVAPRVAALALLAVRTRLPPARLAMLNADQLTNDCSTLDLGGETISFDPDESVLLRAQLLDSKRNGYPANGPMFCNQSGRRTIPGNLQQTLRKAAVDTGLALTQTWSPPIDRHQPLDAPTRPERPTSHREIRHPARCSCSTASASGSSGTSVAFRFAG